MATKRTSRCAARAAAMLTMAATATLGGCIRRPTYELVDLDIRSFGSRRVDLALHFDVHNPNAFPIDLTQLRYEVLVAGRRLAGGDVTGGLPTLLAGGTARVPVPVTLEQERLRDVWEHRPGAQAVDYAFTADVGVRALGFGVMAPLRHEGRIPRVRLPNWRLRRVRFQQEPAPQMELVFAVQDGGDLALSMTGLSGDVKLAGETVLHVYESSLSRPIGPDGSEELVVPVKLGLVALTRAAGKLVARNQRPRFDGEFLFAPPPKVHRMLMGREGPP